MAELSGTKFGLSAMPQQVSFGDSARLMHQARAKSQQLSEAGINETAELIARMADRSLRQERMLYEEGMRSADLELRLARALAGRNDPADQ
jgi:hypothetical protein